MIVTGARWNKIASSHITNKIEVHDDGLLPEGGVVLPGAAGLPVQRRRGTWLISLRQT